MSRGSAGYTLLEIIVVLGILAVAVVGVLRFFQADSAKAAIQQEQTNLSALVHAVDGTYASFGSFAGISTADVASLRTSSIRHDATGTKLLSAFGSPIDIRPATVSAANDAYQVVYAGLNSAECAGLVPAAAGDAYAISINSGASVVSTAAATKGKITDPTVVASQCAGAPFAQHVGSVALTYYRGGRATAGLPPAGCAVSCAPQSESQSIACPVGETGQVNQTRSGTCGGGACPSLSWSPWTTISSSCAPAPVNPPPPVVTPPPPVLPPTPTCTVVNYTRDQTCPTGFSGVITQEQHTLCPSGTLSPWATTGNTCVAVVNPLCQSGSNIQNLVCPAGQFGQITQMQNYSCDANGNHVVDGPWYTVSNNCTTIGTCRPSTRPDGQRNVACAAGQYGQIIQDLEQSSTCSTPTAIPVWGPDVVASSTGTCNACPATITQSQTLACPPGQVGAITQTRSKSYACTPSPVAMPAPTYGAWTTVSNTCVVAVCTPSGGGVWSVKITKLSEGPFSAVPPSGAPGGSTWTPSTGTATFQPGATTARWVATGGVEFDLTVGGTTTSETVACTRLNTTMPGTTDECQYSGQVTVNGITLNVDVDAGGLPQADHVNGKVTTAPTLVVKITQAGGCTNPAATACVPYGNGVPNGITVTPIDLKLDGLGDKGAVFGAYGATAVAAAPTGTASFKVSYKGDTQTVNVACNAANNTSGGTIACRGAGVPVTVGGSAFIASLNTNGPLMDQGLYWDAAISVTQNCIHWILAGTDIVKTNVMNATTPVNGQGTEIPNEDVVPTNGPLTWIIPVNDRIGSGNGPGPNIDPNNSWNGFLNMTGLVKNVPWNTQNNPGYGRPTNPWAAMYASGNYKVYAGPTASQYGTDPYFTTPNCTLGTHNLFATQWVASPNYPMQLLYDGFTCGIGEVSAFTGSSGSPQPPPTGCVKSAASRKVLPDGSVSSTPMMMPPPGC